MSYLQLDNGMDDFSQAVISLWFRVPQSSIDAKWDDLQALPDNSVLEATIPLMTFGVPQSNANYEGALQLVSVYHFVPADIFGNPVDTSVPPYGLFDVPTYSPAGDTPVDPCYIGLDVYKDGDQTAVRLSFNLQTAEHADIAAVQFNRSRADIYQEGPVGIIGNGWTTEIASAVSNTVVDTSYAQQGQPELFLVQSSIRITPDHWHHLLLSFDLNNPVVTHGPPHGVLDATTADGTDSFCRLWYAIDDVNYNGFIEMGPFFVNHGDDPNAILTQNGSRVADIVTGYPYNLAVPPASYSLGPSVIPTHGAELGIPASTAYLERIVPVEMAELQVFTGVTLDTSVEANRRAFITKDGTPADPLKKPNPPPPVPLPTGWVPPIKGPQELLGKAADILLHGSGNWIAGKNTGKVIKLNEIGKPSLVPAEQLTPTGSIVAYSPDPSLHGPQVPPPPPPPRPPAPHATLR